MGEEEGCTAAVIKEAMGGNVEVDKVAVAASEDETGSGVVVGAVSQETGIDVRVIVDDVGETGRGMRDSKS